MIDINVLIIDDNDLDAKMVELYLRKSKSTTERFNLTHKTSLKDGFIEIEKSNYDILLLDLNLPDSSGLDTLKSAKEKTNITLVVLTGEEDERTGIQALKQGAHDYLNKGKFDSPMLIRTLVYAQERKRLIDELQDQRKQFENLIRFLPDALVLVDDNLNIVFQNKAFIEMIGLENNKQEINFLDLLVDKSVYQKMNEENKNLNFNNTELLVKKLDGTTKMCLLSCQNWNHNIIENSVTTQKLITLKDITERIKLNELQKEKEIAEFSVQMKQTFMANMSHEMRTPLNIINGINYLMLKTNLDETQKGYVKNHKFATENLLEIISNILDYSQIEAGKLEKEMEDFNLSHLVNKIVSSFKPLANEKNIVLQLDYEKSLVHFFYSDYFKIKQIITNLTANALKYTNSGKILLKVYRVSDSNNETTIKIIVSDTGVGIPKDKYEQIFESFTQLPTENKKKYAGTGLGLSIVKELVKFLDGKLSVQSEFGIGSTFQVILTVKNSDASKVAIEQVEIHSDASEADFSVLVVEDHRPNQLLIQTFLLNWFHGCKIDIANNGLEALKAVDMKKYDIILMDLQMPEMDGFEATKAIRKSNKPYSNIPIIAVTAHALKHETDKCIECGMDDFITKPIDPEILKEKIEKILDENYQSRPVELIEAKETNQTNLLDEEKVELSLDYLKKLAMNNDTMLLELVKQLNIDAPKEVEQLGILTAEKKWKEIGTLAHKMKATASYMGLMFMIEHFNELINNGRNEINTEKIPAQVALVIKNFNLCIVGLDPAINEINNRIKN
jgi:PAS domain S-box-containing protein